MSLVNVVTTPCASWAPGQIAQSMRGDTCIARDTDSVLECAHVYDQAPA
jgi:hypothetical protein